MPKRVTPEGVEQHFLAIAKRVWSYPPWMRLILLDDIDCAIKNRMAIFDMISWKVSGQIAKTAQKS